MISSRVVMGVILGSKVAVDNKIGERPTGSAATVALALHAGISSALRERDISTVDGAPPLAIATSGSLPSVRDNSGLPDRSELEGCVVSVEAELFARVRKTIGITEQSFHASLALQERLLESNFAMVPTAGRSGAYFFLSPDQYYMLKTMSATVRTRTPRTQAPQPPASHRAPDPSAEATTTPPKPRLVSADSPLKPRAPCAAPHAGPLVPAPHLARLRRPPREQPRLAAATLRRHLCAAAAGRARADALCVHDQRLLR
eukprot:7219696-Prymnesium_polylepis.1